MQKELDQDPQFEIIEYLYQFKDDNKFYSLNKDLLNQQQQKEVYYSIYVLRDQALIATDREFTFKHSDEISNEYFSISDGIKAKILPKGIKAVEAVLSERM